MDLPVLKKILTRARIFPELTDLLPEAAEVFLVGGALRDLLLGREVADFDFTSPSDPTSLAQRFAERVRGHWFPIDQVRRQSRVIVRQGDESVTCDFAPFRGPDLEADLRLRDFTINALVTPVATPEELIDPLGGLDDLAARRLRGCAPVVFGDDPLRVLKGIRHAVTLGFEFEAETARRMQDAAPLLRRVAPERVTAEIGKIFAMEPVSSAVSLMHDFNLLPVLFGPPGTDGSAASGIAMASRMETVMRLAAGHPSTAHLAAEEFEATVSRSALLKLAAFLRGWQPPDLGLSMAHLRLGRRATAAIRHLLDLSAGKGTEADRIAGLERSRALWAAEAGGSVPDTILFLTLLRSEPPGAAFARMEPVVRDWLRLARDGRVPDLVDGNWARDHLGLREGPELGAALAALRRAEIEGRVRTPAEALSFFLGPQKND